MSGRFFWGEDIFTFWAASFDRLENHGICFCRWHFLLFCHQCIISKYVRIEKNDTCINNWTKVTMSNQLIVVQDLYILLSHNE